MNPSPSSPEPESNPDTPQHWWQKPWFKNLATALIILAVFLLLRPFFQGEVIEGKAPTMNVQSLTGKTLNLQQLNQQGKPVLIHFWATWCPICSMSRGGIESLAEDFAVINIATQSADDEQLLAYAKEHDMNPAYIVNDQDGRWMQQFGAKAVPADFIVAPNGDIAFIEVGFTTSFGLRLRLWWAEMMSDSAETEPA